MWFSTANTVPALPGVTDVLKCSCKAATAAVPVQWQGTSRDGA
jgi:hypothetical protein